MQNPLAAIDLETGSFAKTGKPALSPAKLVVATYNMRYGVGPWLISGGLLRRLGIHLAQPRAAATQRNLSLAARAFTGQKRFPAPDIIALQEADNATVRCGGINLARELARQMDWHYAHAPTHLPRAHPQAQKQWYLDFEEIINHDDAGDTGVALLSRFPFAATRLDLPWAVCPWRPRLAIGGLWNFGGRPVQVFNAHIDPHATLTGQLAQHEAILAQAEQTDGPCVLLGDFNTLTRRARKETRRFLESRGYQTPLPNGTTTWRAGALTNHTDWIFVRGARVTRWGVARSLRRVSDHWPIWAEIESLQL